jgi:integrase
MARTNLRLAGSSTKALPKRVAFTDARLEAVKVPEGRDRIYVFDVKMPGLAFGKTRGGSSAFWLVKKINGRPVRYRLADAVVGVERARVLAAETLAKIARGEDPQSLRAAERQRDTLREVFERWEATAGAALKSKAYYARVFRCWCSKLANRTAATITRGDVEKVHAEVGRDHGHHAANRMLAVLSVLFNFARIAPNPVKGIARFREASRERFLQPAELVAFRKAVAAEPAPWKDFWQLALATGARRGNIASMRWSDVNLTAGNWIVPAFMAKAGRSIVVPLSPEAVAILRRRWEARESVAWVFPAASKAGHIVEPRAAWERLLAAAKLTGLRMHDLRRTVGSYLAISGASDRQIGAVLGHQSTAVVGVYARLRTADAAQAMSAGRAVMDALATQAEAEAAKSKPPKVGGSKMKGRRSGR